MKINFEKGIKSKHDQIIKLNCDNEQLTMFDLGLLINQFNLNELTIIKETPKLNLNQNWFSYLIPKSMKDAEKSIDWVFCDKSNIMELSKPPYFVKDDLNKFLEDRKLLNKKKNE